MLCGGLFQVIYILAVFFLVPRLLVGLSELFETDQTAAGSILTALLCAFLVASTWWCYCRGGGTKVANAIEAWKYRGTSDVSPSSENEEEEPLNKADDAELRA